MHFLSLNFAIFVFVVLLLYYSPFFRGSQLPLLVVSSLVFYGWDEWRFVPVIVATVFVSIVCAIKAKQSTTYWLWVGVAVNLVLLGFFKYRLLFFEQPPESAANSVWNWILLLPLPVGISFFVFHNISMMVDFNKEGDRVGPLFSLKAFLYILFFPQLACGPITRASGFFPQIQPKNFCDIKWVAALKWIVAGYFMKAFCADNLQQFTVFMDTTEGVKTLGGLDRIFMVFLFSCQIYADFFGYSAIAIGIALLFGYRLPVNFNLPYITKSFGEFWHRWHISLSTWLRTYLYIPLGGSRRGKFRTELNLLVTMALGGIWHGAGLNYLLWGTLHGVFLCLERPFRPLLQARMNGKLCGIFLAWAYGAFVVACICFAWLLFKIPTFDSLLAYCHGFATDPWSTFRSPYFYIMGSIYAAPVVLQHALAGLATRRAFVFMEPAIYAVLAFLAAVEAGPKTTFIYFQF